MKSANLAEKAMLVNLSVSLWTAKKFDKKVSAQVIADNNAASNAGRFNKSLIAQEEINKIVALQQQARLYHYSVTLPWNDEGSRILPSARYMEYSAKMREFRSSFDSIVSEFVSKYPDLKDQAKLFLGDMFNEADYPTLEKVKGKFAFDVKVFPIPIASDFRVNIQSEEVKRIQAEIETNTKTILENSTKDLYERLYKVVSHLSDKINIPDAIFRNSIISNVCELCDLLKDLNITEDKNLDNLRKEIEEKICTVNPDDLRSDKNLREQKAKETSDILSVMEGYMG